MAFKKGHKLSVRNPNGKFSKTYQPPRENVGRSLAVIDEAKFEEMAAHDCTLEECASELGVSKETLYDRFSHILQKGRLRGNWSLKRRQFEKAMAGDTSMLIWLGKIRLGQKEPQNEEQRISYTVVVNELPK